MTASDTRPCSWQRLCCLQRGPDGVHYFSPGSGFLGLGSRLFRHGKTGRWTTACLAERPIPPRSFPSGERLVHPRRERRSRDDTHGTHTTLELVRTPRWPPSYFTQGPPTTRFSLRILETMNAPKVNLI